MAVVRSHEEEHERRCRCVITVVDFRTTVSLVRPDSSALRPEAAVTAASTTTNQASATSGVLCGRRGGAQSFVGARRARPRLGRRLARRFGGSPHLLRDSLRVPLPAVRVRALWPVRRPDVDRRRGQRRDEIVAASSGRSRARAFGRDPTDFERAPAADRARRYARRHDHGGDHVDRRAEPLLRRARNSPLLAQVGVGAR